MCGKDVHLSFLRKAGPAPPEDLSELWREDRATGEGVNVIAESSRAHIFTSNLDEITIEIRMKKQSPIEE